MTIYGRIRFAGGEHPSLANCCDRNSPSPVYTPYDKLRFVTVQVLLPYFNRTTNTPDQLDFPLARLERDCMPFEGDINESLNQWVRESNADPWRIELRPLSG